jgi:hypothetical protein
LLFAEYGGCKFARISTIDVEKSNAHEIFNERLRWGGACGGPSGGVKPLFCARFLARQAHPELADELQIARSTGRLVPGGITMAAMAKTTKKGGKKLPSVKKLSAVRSLKTYKSKI